MTGGAVITAATVARAVSYHLSVSPGIAMDDLLAASQVEALSPRIHLEEDVEETKLPTVTVQIDGRTFHITVTEDPTTTKE